MAAQRAVAARALSATCAVEGLTATSATSGGNGPLPQGVREGVYDLSGIAPTEPHWWTRGFASRIVIDSDGARVEYTNSGTRALRWDDPTLEFFLVDYRQPVARNDRWATPGQAKRTPFRFTPGSFSRPTSATPVWISEAAYQALYETGFALRLHVNNGGGRGYASDAVVTIFRKRPYALWSVRELNPNAE